MDSSALLLNIMDWITHHAAFAGCVVFLVAFSESLALVGLVVPGATMMFGAGALIAAGALEFWPTMAWAVAGAILGDGISYWLGYHYHDRLRDIWPFRNHSEWLERGESYFRRHGGMSVLIGRFVGPVRPIIPAVAGMLDMRPAVFFTVNILSAIAWAPAYLLPGMALGASLALAGQVAGRLAMLLIILVGALWLIFWSIRHISRQIQRRSAAALNHLLTWGRSHPFFNSVIAGLIEPDKPAFSRLAGMAILLTTLLWLYLSVLNNIVAGGTLIRADEGIYHLLLDLRTPWGDQIMTLVTELGDTVVLLPLSLAVLLWLLWLRCWRSAAYWLAAAGFGMITSIIVNRIPRALHPATIPPELISGHTISASSILAVVVIYGFLSILAAREMHARHRWLPYSLSGLLIGAIAMSHLYLGLRMLSEVLSGLTAGLLWILLLGIAYRHHRLPGLPLRGLVMLTATALSVAGGWHIALHHGADVQRFAPRYSARQIDAQTWWESAWRSVPAQRMDLGGGFEQPLNIQWAGALGPLRRHLAASGWHEPIPLTPASALLWLAPGRAVEELPILPQVHNGRHEALLLTHPHSPETVHGGARGPSAQQLVLRLWPADTKLASGIPLWAGNITRQRLVRAMDLFSILRTEADFDTPLRTLLDQLDGLSWRLVRRTTHSAGAELRWSGEVLLIRSKP